MKNRRIRLKTKILIFIIIAAVIAVVVIFLNNAANVIISVSAAQMRAYNTVAVNDAVEEALPGGLEYGSIVTVEYDGDGNVTTISANSANINAVARRTAYLTQTNLSELSRGGIAIPLGAFTGIEAISGFGKAINIKIMPVASAECSFVSRFTQAGINQTLHSIYIEVVTDITIVFATRTERIFASAEVLVCESLIVGKIPDVYLQGGLLGSGSLVP